MSCSLQKLVPLFQLLDLIEHFNHCLTLFILELFASRIKAFDHVIQELFFDILVVESWADSRKVVLDSILGKLFEGFAIEECCCQVTRLKLIDANVFDYVLLFLNREGLEVFVGRFSANSCDWELDALKT